jgi:hypothetical protein
VTLSYTIVAGNLRETDVEVRPDAIRRQIAVQVVTVAEGRPRLDGSLRNRR